MNYREILRKMPIGKLRNLVDNGPDRFFNGKDQLEKWSCKYKGKA